MTVENPLGVSDQRLARFVLTQRYPSRISLFQRCKPRVVCDGVHRKYAISHSHCHFIKDIRIQFNGSNAVTHDHGMIQDSRDLSPLVNLCKPARIGRFKQMGQFPIACQTIGGSCYPCNEIKSPTCALVQKSQTCFANLGKCDRGERLICQPDNNRDEQQVKRNKASHHQRGELALLQLLINE
ncbi:hypothetical protein D3C74_327970 [compost metagenome]